MGSPTSLFTTYYKEEWRQPHINTNEQSSVNIGNSSFGAAFRFLIPFDAGFYIFKCTSLKRLLLQRQLLV